jgi:hypothetical protein
MTNLVITASAVAIVKEFESLTLPVDEAVTAGQAGRLATATGKLTKANGSGAAEARAVGVFVRSSRFVGEAVTLIKRGVLDLGSALDGLDYDAIIYLSDTDGTLADSVGTVSTKIGRVIPAFGNTTADKLLYVDMAL